MNLAGIAAYACQKVRLDDADALASAKAFARARWSILWDEADWRQARYSQTLAVAAAAQDVTLDADFALVQAARWNAGDELPVISERSLLAADAAALDASGSPGGYIVLPKVAGVCRIRLVPIPREAGSLLVLGKRQCPPLANDTDEPELQGATATLCAFVQGDLWQSLFRQFSKADACYQEANALMQRMRDLENNQATNGWRIVPTVEPDGGVDGLFAKS